MHVDAIFQISYNFTVMTQATLSPICRNIGRTSYEYASSCLPTDIAVGENLHLLATRHDKVLRHPQFANRLGILGLRFEFVFGVNILRRSG